MDEKSRLDATMMHHSHRSIRHIAALVILLFLGFCTYRQFQSANPVDHQTTADVVPSLSDVTDLQVAPALVPLEAHIISKCPDTRVRCGRPY